MHFSEKSQFLTSRNTCSNIPSNSMSWPFGLRHVKSRFSAMCVRLNKPWRFTTTALRTSNLSSFERIPKLLAQVSSSQRRQPVPSSESSTPKLLTMCPSALPLVCYQTRAESTACDRYSVWLGLKLISRFLITRERSLGILVWLYSVILCWRSKERIWLK
jgi:hypothetical protein